jgi:GTPase
MFVDSAKIYLKSGNGGNGCVSFHRMKYQPKGGPDGGDGGKGGDVIFVVDDGLTTLVDFKYKSKYHAQSGKDGQAGNCTGKSAENLIIKVPAGTLIKDYETGRVLADLTMDAQRFVIAKGGRGGAGNQHFATPTRQIPNFAKPGEAGQEKTILLQLKLLADVGLVGFPNAGKSTILSIVSAAKPKIADYPFTTLEPNLGVVRVAEGSSFVLADIPGLIEGAHEGVGIGVDFLKHIERTRLILHVVDLAGVDGRNPEEDFEIINNELESYSPNLSSRKQIVIGNKVDVLQDHHIIEKMEKKLKEKEVLFFPVSAAQNKGITELMNQVSEILKEIPQDAFWDEIEADLVFKVDEEVPYTIQQEEEVFVVEGQWIDRLVRSTNFEDYESLQYFQRAIKKVGLSEELEKMGIEEGDTVVLSGFEMEYFK